MFALRVHALALAPLVCAAACSSKDSNDGPKLKPIVQKITSDDQLIGGIEAAGRPGDYLIANDQVRFIVQDAGSATGWGVYGGSLVDAATAAGDDRLQEIFFQCGLKTFAASKVEIVADGTSGGPGILRFTGRDAGFPLLDAITRNPPLHLATTVDFVLAPQSETLDIVLTAADVQKTEPRDLSCGIALIPGDAFSGFAEGSGHDLGSVDTKVDYFAGGAVGGKSSFVFYRPAGKMETLAVQAEALLLTGETKTLLANDFREEKFHLSVGKGDVESALQVMRRVRKDTAARQPVDLQIGGGEAVLPFAGRTHVRVFDLAQPSRPVAVTSANVDGASRIAKVELPVGRYAAELMLDDETRLDRVEFDVRAGAQTAPALLMKGIGVLSVKASTALKISAGTLKTYAAPAEDLLAPAGDHTLRATLGPEFAIFTQAITVPEGGKVTVEPAPRRAVDSSGWIAIDTHVHCTKSIDSNTARRIRVLGAIAEGLDVLVSTDHDVVSDYAPAVRELGVQQLIRTVAGTEASPLYGHINGYPLPPASPEKFWEIAWFTYGPTFEYDRTLDPIELVNLLRARGAKVVQINHPRTGSGVFDFLKLDQQTGMTEKEWPNPDAFELMNDTDEGEIQGLLLDWTAMFRAGRRVTAIGVSDAHGFFGVGYSRTMVRVSKDAQGEIDLDEVWRSMKEGRAVATTGPLVTMDARAGGMSGEIGDTLAVAANTPVEIHVKVQAPLWMDVDRLALFENGVQTATVALTSSTAVRLDRTFSVRPAADAMYYVIVEGSDRSPVIDARARAITNPIFIDADGGGFRLR